MLKQLSLKKTFYSPKTSFNNSTTIFYSIAVQTHVININQLKNKMMFFTIRGLEACKANFIFSIKKLNQNTHITLTFSFNISPYEVDKPFCKMYNISQVFSYEITVKAA